MDICKRAQFILNKRRQIANKQDDEDSLSGISEYEHQEKASESVSSSSEIEPMVKDVAVSNRESMNIGDEETGDVTEIEFESDQELSSDPSNRGPTNASTIVNLDPDNEYISFDDDQISDKSTVSPTILITQHRPRSDSQKTLTRSTQDSHATLISFDDNIESQSRLSTDIVSDDAQTIAYSDDFEDVLSNIVDQTNEELDPDNHDGSVYSRDFEEIESDLEHIQNSNFIQVGPVESPHLQVQSFHERNPEQESASSNFPRIAERPIEHLEDKRFHTVERVPMSDIGIQATETIDQCIQVNRWEKFQGLFYTDPRLDLVPEHISARLSAIANKIQYSRDQLHQDRRLLSYTKYTTLRDVQAQVDKIRRR